MTAHRRGDRPTVEDPGRADGQRAQGGSAAGSIPFAGRLLGLDLGTRRVGVAVSDGDQKVATGVAVVHRSRDRARDHQRLADLVVEYGAVAVIVGLPLSLSGDVGPAAPAALDELDDLAGVVGVPVAAYDERFTTVRASRALAAGGTGGRSLRTVVDQTAAAVMLQSWLDRDEGGSRRA